MPAPNNIYSHLFNLGTVGAGFNDVVYTTDSTHVAVLTDFDVEIYPEVELPAAVSIGVGPSDLSITTYPIFHFWPLVINQSSWQWRGRFVVPSDAVIWLNAELSGGALLSYQMTGYVLLAP